MSGDALRVLLVDPSLYTGPYDAALDAALNHAGAATCWATRPPRRGQERHLPAAHCDEFFYRRVDDGAAMPALLRPAAKGLAHIWGLAKLVARVWRQRPQVVHFQWTVVPLLDSLAMLAIRARCPVVLTVHDTTPYNGARPFFGAVLGFDLPMRLAHRVVVHTRAGREALVARGVPAARIEIIAHGPLSLNVRPTPDLPRDPRWTFVAFGEMKPYKGLDLLVEAAARLSAELRTQARVVIAGRPMMDLGPLRQAIDRHGLASVVELRERRLSEQEMADLFAHTDCFVFPYRQIDASGVFFLVRSLGRWLIASRVGIFAEALRAGAEGMLVPPEDVNALAAALADAVRRRPLATALPDTEGWSGIGEATVRLYRSLLTGADGAGSRHVAAAGEAGTAGAAAAGTSGSAAAGTSGSTVGAAEGRPR